MNPSAASLDFIHNLSHKSQLGLPAQLQQKLMVGSSEIPGKTAQTKPKAYKRREELGDLSFPCVLGFEVRLWFPYLEGHNKMSEMKLSLQVQLDSHIFQTCRGIEKKPCSKQRHPPHSMSNFDKVLQWHRDSSLCHLALLSKRDMRVSALLTYRGDTKVLLKIIFHMGSLCTICTKRVTPKV